MFQNLSRRQREGLLRIGRICINLPFVIVIMLPLVYTLMISIKPASEIYTRFDPASGGILGFFFPSRVDFLSYLHVFERTAIPRNILNSFIVATSVTLGQMITCSMAAFAFSFLEFRGRNFLFLCILATMMVPWEATIIANYLTVSAWGWRDTYKVLIIPYMCSAMGIFLLRQNYLTFAKELHEAAKLDGCNNWRFLLTIVVPLARPALGALGAYVFLNTWNQYFWPLLVTDSDKVRTVQIGISQLYDIDSEQIGLMMAGVVIVIIPSLSIFVFMQKQLINGLMAGAVKG